VRVRSRAGELTAQAQLTETVRPDVVVVPHGYGHRSPWLSVARGIGQTDNELIPALRIEDLQQSGNWLGAGCVMDCVVAIEPAE